MVGRKGEEFPIVDFPSELAKPVATLLIKCGIECEIKDVTKPPPRELIPRSAKKTKARRMKKTRKIKETEKPKRGRPRIEFSGAKKK
jgi:hypothetical protein